MIGRHRVLAVIPGRGGSKGLPRKNVLPLGGKPLIAWTIESAKASAFIDRVVVSTDDPEIEQAALRFGAECPIPRRPEHATDQARIEPVILDILDRIGEPFDIVLLLQPTSPLRTAEDIDGVLQALEDSGAPACVAVAEPSKSPYWMVSLGDDGTMQPLFGPDVFTKRRQELPPAYAITGAVYAARVDFLRQSQAFNTVQSIGYVMPAERALDVDTARDLRMVEAALAVKADKS